MEEYEFQNQELPGTRESSERIESRELEDATLEPFAYIEQVGNFQQAEEIQYSLERMMSSITTEGSVGVVPPHEPGHADASQATEKPEENTGGERAIPITVPDVQMEMDQVGATSLPIPNVARDVSVTPLPIPNVAQEVGATPLPIPKPEDESMFGSLPHLRGDLDRIKAIGSDTPGGDEATPIPLPGQRGAAVQEAASEKTGVGENRVSQDEQVSKQKDPPPPPPDISRMEPEAIFGVESETVLVDQPGQEGFIKEETGEVPTPLSSLGEGVNNGEYTSRIEQLVKNAESEMGIGKNITYHDSLENQDLLQKAQKKFSLFSYIVKMKHDVIKNLINNVK